MVGEKRCQLPCRRLVQGARPIDSGDGIQKRLAAGAVFGAGQRSGRPVGVGLIHQAKIQKPFARIVHDIQMHGPDTLKPRQHARRPDPQR